MKKPKSLSVAVRRAHLVAQCAEEILGVSRPAATALLRLDLTVEEFQSAILQRYAHTHPDLAVRSESTIERARLLRTAAMEGIPRVVLRRGAPVRRRRPAALLHHEALSP